MTKRPMIRVEVGFWTNDRDEPGEAWLKGAVWANKDDIHDLPAVAAMHFNGPFELLSVMHRVLKKAGVLLFSTNNGVIRKGS